MRPIANFRSVAAGMGKPEAMVDGEKTSATLLNRVGDWRDHPAWLAFFGRYDPLLRRWCVRFGLDADASDELCQRIWVELMARLRTLLRPEPRVPGLALAAVPVPGHRPVAAPADDVASIAGRPVPLPRGIAIAVAGSTAGR
jgi:hypothetical protein